MPNKCLSSVAAVLLVALMSTSAPRKARRPRRSRASSSIRAAGSCPVPPSWSRATARSGVHNRFISERILHGSGAERRQLYRHGFAAGIQDCGAQERSRHGRHRGHGSRRPRKWRRHRNRRGGGRVAGDPITAPHPRPSTPSRSPACRSVAQRARLHAVSPRRADVQFDPNSTVNGLPQSSINITLDGVNIQDNTLKSTDGFFAIVSPRLDAIEEASLTSAAQGADASGQGGVQIKFTTRSGSNAVLRQRLSLLPERCAQHEYVWRIGSSASPRAS